MAKYIFASSERHLKSNKNKEINFFLENRKAVTLYLFRLR